MLPPALGPPPPVSADSLSGQFMSASASPCLKVVGAGAVQCLPSSGIEAVGGKSLSGVGDVIAVVPLAPNSRPGLYPNLVGGSSVRVKDWSSGRHSKSASCRRCRG